MKKYILIAIIATAFASCKKEQNSGCYQCSVAVTGNDVGTVCGMTPEQATAYQASHGYTCSIKH